MITENQLNNALEILGCSDCFVGSTGFGGIGIDRMNEMGTLQERVYYFETDEEFENFILTVIGE